MAVADFHTGSVIIQNSMKNLLLRWEATKEQWNDSTTKKSEEEHIETLVPKIKVFLETAAQLSDLLQRTEMECK